MCKENRFLTLTLLGVRKIFAFQTVYFWNPSSGWSPDTSCFHSRMRLASRHFVRRKNVTISDTSIGKLFPLAGFGKHFVRQINWRCVQRHVSNADRLVMCSETRLQYAFGMGSLQNGISNTSRWVDVGRGCSGQMVLRRLVSLVASNPSVAFGSFCAPLSSVQLNKTWVCFIA